ncbi:MAG: extracellular solute-binding protein [Candidatus Nanopelagicales bacterium]
MRAITRFTAVLLAGALSLTACGGGGQGASPTTVSPASTITIWAADEWAEPLAMLAASQATAGVKLEVVSKSEAEIHTTLAGAAAQGQGPDLFIGPSEWVGELQAAGVLSAIDLGDEAGGFSAQSLDSVRLTSRLYGVPISAENLALLRNRALAPTVPESIEDMVAAGKQIAAGKPAATSPPATTDGPGATSLQTTPPTDATPQTTAGPHTDATTSTDGAAPTATPSPATTSPTPTRTATAEPTPTATGTIKPVALALPIGAAGDPEAWYPLFSAYGGYIYAQADNGAVDPLDLGVGLPGSVDAGTALASLVERKLINPKLDRATAAAVFATGKSAFLIGGPDDVASAKTAGIDVAIDPVPPAKHDNLSRSQALVSYQAVMLSAFARDRDAALSLLSQGVMSTDFMDACFAAHPRQPAWLASFRKVAADPVMASFAAYAEDSIPVPNVAWMQTVWEELSQAQVAITKGKDSKTSLQAARKAIERAASR